MSERKRRSRFDVPPDDPSILSLTSTTNIPISAHGNEGESLSEKTTQAIATIQQQLKSLSSSSSWIPVEDFKFRQRLEDSLHKNFDYIYRKDMFPDEFLKAKKARDVNNTSKRANNDSDMQSRHLGGIGIGADPTIIAPKHAENCQVYVSGFPTDITDEDIDILFSSVGKIKKIKLYSDAQGGKKGDALVTYVSADSATMAAMKLNSLDIGEGFILSVAMAEYKRDSAVAPDVEGKSVIFQPSSGVQLQSVFVSDNNSSSSNSSSKISSSGSCHSLQTLLELLDNSPSPIIEHFRTQSWKNYFPAVISTCEFPILLLRHAYDPSQTNRRNTEDAYLADIQTDLMIECCKFGKIKSIFLPTIDSSSWLNGCAFVTFLKDAEARECAAYLHNRNFERRKLKVCLCLSKEQEEEEHNSSNQFIDIVETKCEESANMIDIEADVESFLNTLL